VLHSSLRKFCRCPFSAGLQCCCISQILCGHLAAAGPVAPETGCQFSCRLQNMDNDQSWMLLTAHYVVQPVVPAAVGLVGQSNCTCATVLLNDCHIWWCIGCKLQRYLCREQSADGEGHQQVHSAAREDGLCVASKVVELVCPSVGWSDRCWASIICMSMHCCLLRAIHHCSAPRALPEPCMLCILCPALQHAAVI
jgi:hypothetical protein